MSTVRSVCLALLFALSLAVPARAEEPTLEGLLAEFAKVTALSAHFREEKTMALLAVPLVSEGDIYYERPRRLARHTKTPGASSVVLDGAQLSFGDAQHKESMGVDAHPALRVLVDTFVSVLSGDQERLLAMADVKLEKVGARGFKIHVTPKEPNVLKLVRSMSFEGEGPLLTKMELLDANGDRSVTTFSSVKPQATFSPDQAKRLFRVGS
jgi:outer membrane lipoprotein-sorting protein